MSTRSWAAASAPVRSVRRLEPAAAASASTSASRDGGPYTSTASRPAYSATSSAGRPLATALPWDMIVTVSARRSASSM